jgi:serine/threonine protein kinase
MVEHMICHPSVHHAGYTKAVDWWSLGVTMYRLLSYQYPFNTDVAVPQTPEARATEGSERYSALQEDVDYGVLTEGRGLDTDTVDIVSHLLAFEARSRLGYGQNGSSALSEHRFFRGINWIELERKASRPPPLPMGCSLPEKKWVLSTTLESVLAKNRLDSWLDYKIDAAPGQQFSEMLIESERAMEEQLKSWDYVSPVAVLMELGDSHSRKS